TSLPCFANALPAYPTESGKDWRAPARVQGSMPIIANGLSYYFAGRSPGGEHGSDRKRDAYDRCGAQCFAGEPGEPTYCPIRWRWKADPGALIALGRTIWHSCGNSGDGLFDQDTLTAKRGAPAPNTPGGGHFFCFASTRATSSSYAVA